MNNLNIYWKKQGKRLSINKVVAWRMTRNGKPPKNKERSQAPNNKNVMKVLEEEVFCNVGFDNKLYVQYLDTLSSITAGKIIKSHN